MLESFRFWHRHSKPSSEDPQTPGFMLHGLKTASECWLSAAFAGRSATGLIGLADEAAGSKVLLCVVPMEQSAGYLIAKSAEPIALPGLDMTGPCLPVKIERDYASGWIKLHHPLARNRRLGVRDDHLSFDLRPPDEATAFMCEPFPEDQISRKILWLTQHIAQSMQTPLRWQTILENLQSGEIGPALAEAFLHRLPIDELQDLSAELLHSPRYRKLLAQCLDENPWSSTRLEALALWRADRDAARRPVVTITDKQFADIPGTRGNLSFRPQLGLSLHALMRRGTQPRRMACVLGSARNEGPYLLEWIAYHRAIGVDHVFIYANDNSDGSDELLDLLARNGIITWIRSEVGPQTLPQFRAYAHALSVLPDTLDYRWTLIADLDEYLAYDIGRFTCLRDYLSWQEANQAEAIALPWLIHVAGPEDSWREAPCTERFMMRQSAVNHHVKTMFRTNLFWSSTAHNPYASLGNTFAYKADNGQPHVAKPPENNLALARHPQATHAWIAHYIFKSASDVVMKAMRGKGDRVESERQAGLDNIVKPFISLANDKGLVLDQRTARCGVSLRDELSTLRSLPGVAACEAEIKRAYQQQMRAFCLQIIQDGPQPDETAEASKFRSILLKQRQNELFAAT